MARRARQAIRRWIWPDWAALIPLLWGGLLLKYWLTGQLKRLIHPNYTGLVAFSGVVLLVVGGLHLWQRQRQRDRPGITANLLPGQLTTGLLVGVAVAGFIIPPGTLGSQAALQRGLGDTLPVTRQRPEPFQLASDPATRSLVDWVRTLNAYPEPEAYRGQPARIEGFVMHLDTLPENILLVARFIVSCCAVDAYPVALPVVLPPGKQLADFPVDSWVEVQGNMAALTRADNTRQTVLQAKAIAPIPTPRDPYRY